MGVKYYAGNKLTGLAEDTKPTSNIIDGSTFFVTDTEDLFMYDLGTTAWKVVSGNTIAETLSSKTLTSPVLNTSLSGTAFLDENDFASDSDNKVASQQSIKAYVASQVSGSQNVFSTIAVSGQDNVVADSTTDTLTIVAGSNMTITTTAGSDTVTFATTGGTQNLFQTIAVSGQSNVVADSTTDTLTLVGGTNITLTTNASTDTVTIAASSSSSTVTVTDNENTNENNLITFVADAATSTGSHGLEMDGNLNYNPSTGRLTSTQLAGTLQTAAQTNITSVGALDGGSITSNFGAINTGASVITTTGLISGGSLDIDDVLIDGTTIGHTNDTDLMTVASGLLTVAGEISVTTLDIGGTNVTSTAAEINIMDGGTAATGTTLANADRVVVNDNGTMVQVALTDFETYFESALDTLSNVTTVGALNAGSITSGFGTIDTGSSNISTTGTIATGILTVSGNLTVSGTTTTVNTATLTIEDPLIALANNNTTNSVDIGFYGTYRTNGTDLYTGLVWDGSASQYILFHANEVAPTTIVNTSGTGYAVSTLVANLTGTASVATEATSITAVANNSTNETVYPTFVDGATGTQGLETDTGLTYNPSTGALTSATFVGAVTGDVTGNTSGTAATVTGATQAAITSAANLATVGTIGTGVWNGTAVITTYGGTGLASYTAGDMFYYASGTTLTKLAKGSAAEVLTMNSGATAPEWAVSSSGASESFAIAMAVAL